MGIFMGNQGNLMQHWVLCEVLEELARKGFHKLTLATTHSMAPWSVPRKLEEGQANYSRPTFERVRNRPPERRASSYERAWHFLSPCAGLPYPSSALLARQVWKDGLSLLLCEVNPIVADEIAGWMSLPEVAVKISPRRLFRGDWRSKFQKSPFQGWEGDVLLVELDPMRFEHNTIDQCRRDDRAVFYVEDLEIVVGALKEIRQPAVIQLSSFSANNNNPHRIIEPRITSAFGEAGFDLRARVDADGNMISMVYSRNVALWEAATSLNEQFHNWLSA